MKCPDQETLMLLADSELSAVERAAIEEHIAGCETCRDVVDEMRALNSIARSSLRSLRVSPPRIVLPRRRRMLQGLALAAAMIALAVSLAAVLLTNRRGGGVVTIAHAPPSAVPATTAQVIPDVPPLLDEAFERWAAEHRRKQIPLIPLEEVVTYEPPEIRPFHPAGDFNL